ncbi:MAG: hypothetical protein EG823_04670 [Actinobacteria bacterium]|nr:hypothetical protein [Actinomycetota bacterium]
MVSRLKDWRVIVAVLALLALIGGGVAVLANRAPEEDGTPDNPIAAIFDRKDADEDQDGDSAPDETAASTAPLIDTAATGEVAPPKKTTKKSTAATTPAAPGVNPEIPAEDPVWQRYLADTRQVVTTNAGDLTVAVSAITTALGSGDAGALKGYLPPDEPGGTQFANQLADTYPTILTSQPASTVNIFSAGGTTLYFGYSVVQWTDAGIISEHTIPIVMRYVNGEWSLTTLGDSPDLLFIQSVQI